MDIKNYEQNDPNFISDLRESKKTVAKAATFLSNLGYPVIVRPTFERPDAAQMSEYADEGDLEILQRVEVKHRPEINFTGAADFPYDTIIIDVCHTYDNARPKPYAYMIFNASHSVVAIIDVKTTKSQWKKTRKFDNKKKRERNFYECPINLVRFSQTTTDTP